MFLDCSWWEYSENNNHAHPECDWNLTTGNVSATLPLPICDVIGMNQADIFQSHGWGTFKLGLKFEDWLLVRDNMGNIGRYMWDVSGLESVVICR